MEDVTALRQYLKRAASWRQRPAQPLKSAIFLALQKYVTALLSRKGPRHWHPYTPAHLHSYGHEYEYAYEYRYEYKCIHKECIHK